MENHTSEENTSGEEQTPKSGTMSFIDHLDELRKRLIRYFIVLMVFVLATYGFRKDILDLIRKPVDEPLEKYTSTQQYTPTKPDASAPTVTSLDSYNCACKELPTPSTQKTEGSAVSEETADETSTETKEKLTQKAGSWMQTGKEAVNDFVIFFQALVGKKPSPVFETAKHQKLMEESTAPVAGYQPLPDHLNLNCKCSLATASSDLRDSHSSMVFIGLPELFFAQMKVAIFAGIFLSFPYLLIEIWGFVGPALYRSEKKVFWIFAIASYFFFIGGALFGYFVVFPFGFDFFLSLTQMGEIMPSLSVGQYLSFAIKLLLAFGFIFELPLATFILARLGVITPELMIRQSRVAIMIVFILSAMLDRKSVV